MLELTKKRNPPLRLRGAEDIDHRLLPHPSEVVFYVAAFIVPLLGNVGDGDLLICAP